MLKIEIVFASFLLVLQHFEASQEHSEIFPGITGCNLIEYRSYGGFFNLDLVVTHSTAECDGISLKPHINLFPTKEPYNLLELTFRNSDLSEIYTGIFQSFTNMTTLNMNRNSINIIHPEAFNGLYFLQTLHLEYNNLSVISKGFLNPLSNLQELYLNNNNISKIELDSFEGLHSLEYLHLAYNGLTHITLSTLDQLVYLKHIDISHNNLQEFEVNINPSVTYCDISYNSLKDIHLPLFSYNLSRINIENNKLSIISISTDDYTVEELLVNRNNLTDIFDIGRGTSYIDFSNNIITNINVSKFNDAKSLETLFLSFNRISNLPLEFPTTMTSLKHLYLDNNALTYIPTGCFKSLRGLVTLDVSFNDLTELDPGTFTRLSALEKLDISNNKLKHLHESSLFRLSSLTELLIYSNNLNYLDPRELTHGLKSLKTIQLEDNDWNCRILAKVLNEFNNTGVLVIAGITRNSPNVHGISCYKNNSRDDQMNSTEIQCVLKLSKYLEKLINLSGGNTPLIVIGCIIIVALLGIIYLLYVHISLMKSFDTFILNKNNNRDFKNEVNVELLQHGDT